MDREIPKDPMQLMLEDYRLTTAEITYHMPDHPALLQIYVWQEYDHSPDYPELHRFLDFWERKLDGKLHSVVISDVEIIKPSDFRHFNSEFFLH